LEYGDHLSLTIEGYLDDHAALGLDELSLSASNDRLVIKRHADDEGRYVSPGTDFYGVIRTSCTETDGLKEEVRNDIRSDTGYSTREHKVKGPHLEARVFGIYAPDGSFAGLDFSLENAGAYLHGAVAPETLDVTMDAFTPNGDDASNYAVIDVNRVDDTLVIRLDDRVGQKSFEYSYQLHGATAPEVLDRLLAPLDR
jgi:hypothetical protein